MCMPVRALDFNVNPKQNTMHKESTKKKRDVGLYIMNPAPKKARAHIRKLILSFFLWV